VSVSTQAPPAATDPSAALVERIASDALNPSYRERTQARARAEPARSGRGISVTVVTVAVVGLLLGVLVVAAQQRAESVDSERSSLVALATQAREEVGVLTARVAELDAEVRELRDSTLGSQRTGAQDAEEIQRLGISAGVAPVSGPGARVVLTDGDPEVGGGDEALSRVLDIDLQQVVNGLWEAGAESVQVNGQRVGALTAIRSVQDVILVNYSPVVGPYSVTAIGDPRTLATDFLRSSGGDWLQAVNVSAGIRFGIDSVADDLPMSGAPVGSLRYAVPANETPQDAT
jgi:uncharacterized protein YlxW (UPF0749 family)